MSKTSVNKTSAVSVRPTHLYQIAAWTLSITVSTLAILAWGSDYSWQFTPFSAYTIFPLLGLVAFSLMWAHYVAGTFSDIFGLTKPVLARYFSITGWAVLILICLHPGLLIYQRFRDGAGLPPHSYETYVAPGLGWITLLGTASFFVFLAYEFHRLYGDRSWWHYVQEAGDIAMLAIFYHGLRLGGQLSHSGWFRGVWFFYGTTLVAILIRSYYKKYFSPAKSHLNI